MPKKTPVDSNEVTEEKKRKQLSPEALEKLKKARELALEARRNRAKIDNEHKEIKETFGQKVDEVTMYQKVKEKVDDEVKRNEIVAINKRLEEFTSKFDGFLQDREKRKQEKAVKKEQKHAREIVRELPVSISQKLLDEEIKKQELERFKRRIFGF